MSRDYTEESCILDPESVRDISDEKREFYTTHGYVPYRVGGSGVKWASKGQAVREIQAYLYRHSSRNIFSELRYFYSEAREQQQGVVSACFIALHRFIAESR